MPESTQIDQEQPQDMILNKEGKPWELKRTAASVLKLKKTLSEDEWETVEFNGGWALARKAAATAAPEEAEPEVTMVTAPPVEAAKAAAAKPAGPKMIKADPYGYFLKPSDPKTCLCPICLHIAPIAKMGEWCENPRARKQCEGRYGEDSTVFEELYVRVKFSAKSNPNDEEQVMLSANGESLKIMREKEVVIKGRFASVAQTALCQKFKQVPFKPRKELNPIQTFPFTELGRGTKEELGEEYEKSKREGTIQTKRSMSIRSDDVEVATG